MWKIEGSNVESKGRSGEVWFEEDIRKEGTKYGIKNVLFVCIEWNVGSWM
jgi:hypothetical protein